MKLIFFLFLSLPLLAEDSLTKPQQESIQKLQQKIAWLEKQVELQQNKIQLLTQYFSNEDLLRQQQLIKINGPFIVEGMPKITIPVTTN